MFLAWSFHVYVAVVAISTILQVLTKGAYFAHLTFVATFLGYTMGMGLESKRYGSESLNALSRAISRGALYALPPAFSGSLLMLWKAFPGGHYLVVVALFMLAVQVAVIVYIGRTRV